MEQPHDPGNVGGGAADGQLVAADVEVHGRKLLFDETQRLIVAAERLNHLFGVVEDDHLRPDTGKTMGKFTCGALSGAEPGPSVCCFSHGAGLRASGPLQLGILSLRPITSPPLLRHRASVLGRVLLSYASTLPGSRVPWRYAGRVQPFRCASTSLGINFVSASYRSRCSSADRPQTPLAAALSM